MHRHSTPRSPAGPGALIALLLIVVASGCAVAPPMAPHPLAGRLFDTATQRELGRDALMERVAGAQIIYLGEKHDNAHHHAEQLAVLEALVARGRAPAIAFEVVSVPATSVLMSYVRGGAARHGLTAEAAGERLRAQLGWSEDDDNWSYYGALLEFAREHGLRAVGIDLPRALRRRITRVGTDGLTAVEHGQLDDSGFEDAVYESLMHARFKQAHCGYGRPAHLARLYQTWLARNDAMARAVVATAQEQPGEPVVVILGGGHAVNGMGVPERVARLAPDLRQLNIGFREVGDENTAEPYLASTVFEGRDFGPPHEVVWLTPPAPRDGPDPCEAFREHMKRVGERPS